jgi:hypothetical protein
MIYYFKTKTRLGIWMYLISIKLRNSYSHHAHLKVIFFINISKLVFACLKWQKNKILKSFGGDQGNRCLFHLIKYSVEFIVYKFDYFSTQTTQDSNSCFKIHLWLKLRPYVFRNKCLCEQTYVVMSLVFWWSAMECLLIMLMICFCR